MVDDLQSSEEVIYCLAFVAEEVDRIILQSVEHYLKDQSYDENEVSHWVDLICDGIMKGLSDLRKPLKYIGRTNDLPLRLDDTLTPTWMYHTVSCVIMQKNGAGIHSAVSCHWDTAIDGAHVVKWPSDKHKEHNRTMYCIVTVGGLGF
ncbi:hypothetical protein AaE_000480 [Aphanomyces astaci]|uniref:Dynein light chain n=1 Tax=Aphanomyces astaci TaxID=112090 RepID=A0A6A5AZ00_APHAT|nr:hypothetical protein AaE_000480 [Aphanomyces astaci]